MTLDFRHTCPEIDAKIKEFKGNIRETLSTILSSEFTTLESGTEDFLNELDYYCGIFESDNLELFEEMRRLNEEMRNIAEEQIENVSNEYDTIVDGLKQDVETMQEEITYVEEKIANLEEQANELYNNGE